MQILATIRVDLQNAEQEQHLQVLLMPVDEGPFVLTDWQAQSLKE